MALSKYSTISEAVASGDQIEALKATADSLAEALDNCESLRDQSSLSLRLLQTLQQIEALQPSKKETAADKRKREAAAKRKITQKK